MYAIRSYYGPLARYADRLPSFKAVIDILTGCDAAYGNLETTIFDPRTFIV